MSWGLTPDQEKNLILSVGVQRKERRLNPIEIAKLFRHMMRNGASLSDCSRLVHLAGTSMVSRFLKLLELRAEFEPLIDFGHSEVTVSASSAWQIARLPHDEHSKVFRSAVEESFTSKEIEQLVQYRLRRGVDVEESISQALKMRPQIERQHLFLGRLSDSSIASSIKLMSQPARDRLITSALGKINPVLQNCSAKLSADRFSVLGDSRSASVIRSLEPDFEVAITEAIGACVD